jgi:tuftelin-interacting protein 11
MRRLGAIEGDQDFGRWESHEKGIGSKLLQKMGYKVGMGLGKNLQGITAPIEAKKRGGSGAIGFYGPEHKHKPMINEEQNKSAYKTPQRIKSEIQWKKTEESVKRAKVVIQSADDLIAQNLLKTSWNDNEVTKVKVIDMTGPEQRILSGYHQIHQQKHEKPSDETNAIETRKESFNIPELEHNIDLLVKIAEDEILENSRELRRETERYSNLEEERERISEVIEEERKHCENIEKILKNINDLVKKLNENELTIDELFEKYDNLREENPIEFESLKLHEILIPTAFPLLKRILEDWKPLQNPLSVKDLFERLKIITYPNEDGIYEVLMWDIWMPVVRREIMEWPTMKQCDEVINFLESWRKLLPDWLFDNIIEQIVLPLLQKEVEEWNPLTDTVPIHSWLHPWLPLMVDRSLEHLYDPIRHKLANALTNWHPSDRSAQLILEPWKGVFSNGSLEAFLKINIVPKLEIAMQSLLINPHQQCLDLWHWVMSWQDLLSTHIIASILEKHFFPRWLNVLFNWLSNGPNFDEVSKWYSGWKSMLSPQLQSHPSIKDALKRALDMMDHSVNSSVGMKSFNSYYSIRPQQPTVPNPNRMQNLDPFGLAKDKAMPNITLNFKQLVERKAEEHGILFMPIPNRYYEGKQVYKFGKLIIHIDRQVLFLFINNNWVPTSLQSLIDSAL